MASATVSGDKPVKLERNYAADAPSYDANRFSGRSGRFLYETDRRIIREMVTLANPRTILDVPTGTGRVLDYLSDHPASLTAVDCTTEMLQQAKRFDRSGQVAFEIGNAAALPYDDASFDCLISLRFFHLFGREQRRPFAREFSRVLKPGGHLLISMTNGWYAGGVNWAKKYAGKKTMHFEHHGEMVELFPGWKTRSLQGNFLPLQWAADCVPGTGRLLRWGTRRYPLNRICWERFHLLQKPQHSAANT